MTLQAGLEFDNLKPWLKSGGFKCISWLNGLFFGVDDRSFLKDGVKTYLKSTMSPLNSPIFFFTSIVFEYCRPEILTYPKALFFFYEEFCEYCWTEILTYPKAFFFYEEFCFFFSHLYRWTQRQIKRCMPFWKSLDNQWHNGQSTITGLEVHLRLRKVQQEWSLPWNLLQQRISSWLRKLRISC